jgi:hypothetical protein
VAALESRGWSIWWDPAITPGQEFDRPIATELARASAVLVVWTADSVQSRWVRGEARDGADRGILVPVRYDEAVLPIDFRAFHTIDLVNDAEAGRSNGFQEVVRTIDGLLTPRRTTTARQRRRPALQLRRGPSAQESACSPSPTSAATLSRSTSATHQCTTHRRGNRQPGLGREVRSRAGRDF